MSLAIWEYWRTNPSYLRIKHCTAKQTKSSHNVKTDSRFIDKKLSLVFFKPHEEDYMKSTEVQNWKWNDETDAPHQSPTQKLRICHY